ncbi:uncharacterized protein LOC113273220 [Papaver somniferum]|uniref:uncharacterized protein LOC113273220 n=1 Tax=Papaver somniferum TaxID=3469 RepID=UPI000E7009A0|nr:uncharacterized protein LOC113273220 [Papaver somniferum]
MVVAEFKFCNQTVSHLVSFSTTVKDMISLVKQKWPYVPEELILFGYTVDGTSNVINHDLELGFFIHYCSSQGIDLLKFEIQLRACVDYIPSSSYSAPAPSSSSSSSCISIDEVVVVEDITDDACLIKKVQKKSDAWVNILTGVGSCFKVVLEKLKHSCSLASSDPSKVRMRKSFMKDILADDLRALKKKKTASEVIDLFRNEYGVDLTYIQAYHGLNFTKQFLWGDDIKSYSDFVWYKDAIEHYNPGSVVNFEYDSVTRQFKRFFVSFEAFITGFNNYCRPMLFIDFTFLTGKFKGGLMVACGKTVAFGLVPCENCENWKWFLTKLKGIIREDRPLTIISYRGIDLLKHVTEVFPNAYQSFCLYHMKGNILVPKGKSRQTAVKLFEQCYTALTKENFYAAAKSMSNLKLDSVVAWMMKIPLEKWDAHAFPGETWGENTSNIAESFNNVIKSDKPLLGLELVDSIRAKVMEHNYKRKLESYNWNKVFTPRIQARFNKRINDCRSYRFRRSSEKVFEIISPIRKQIVDLDSRTCSCRWWQKHS